MLRSKPDIAMKSHLVHQASSHERTFVLVFDEGGVWQLVRVRW